MSKLPNSQTPNFLLLMRIHLQMPFFPIFPSFFVIFLLVIDVKSKKMPNFALANKTTPISISYEYIEKEHDGG